ncbi:glycoside hydrolase family 127 protein [Candidatus Poribacteria bacterium]
MKLKSVGIGDVKWTEGFWADWFNLCHKVMIPNMWQLLKDPKISHSYENFLIAAGMKEGEHHGPKWHDGDFYKWLESVAHVYAITKDEILGQLMDEIIEVIGKVQREDGYIHTPAIIKQRETGTEAEEFKNRLDFETYNIGHLMTTACIHHRATGKTSLMEIAKRAADYLYRFYKDSPGKLANNAICPSHYMGVVEMYRTTGEPRYLELAKGLIEIRGLVGNGTDHNQDRVPFREQTKAVGHAVRANYLYAGVADVYSETGDEAFLNALEKIWENVTYQKMYITGATGALYDGASPDGSKSHKDIQLVHQAYGREYQLPNITAYNETCATIGNVMWNWRMLGITGEARFADVLELALYNGVLSTVSLDGRKFFYANALRRVGDLPYELRWSRTREPYISCFCCPPNAVRTIAKLSGYAYSVSDEGIWVNLYGSNELNTTLADESEISVVQDTDYPWDGKVEITVNVPESKRFSVMLRIPGWASEASLEVNGQRITNDAKPGIYAVIDRVWSAGDTIGLDLPIQVRLIQANPLVEELHNQIAVMRGPIVYCLESVDLPEGVAISRVTIPRDIELKPRHDSDLLGGVTLLEGKAETFESDDWSVKLYQELKPQEPRQIDIKLIPYYAWDDRGECDMTVWMPVR